MIKAAEAKFMMYNYSLYKDTFDRIEKSIIAAAKKGEIGVDIEFIEDGNLSLYSQYLREQGFITNYNSTITNQKIKIMRICW